MVLEARLGRRSLGGATREIGVMLIGGAGFWLHNAVLLYLCTFLMGVHSTVFGPVKYAYLPQHLDNTELVGGNGMVEMGTFIAILLGTILGSAAAGSDAHGATALAVSCVVIAIVGRVVSSFVPQSTPSQPDLRINWNPVSETWRNLKLARENRTVSLSLLGISWLWFVGATFLSSFFRFAKDVLSANPDVVTVLPATFSIGIGTGSMLCERLSKKRIEIGLVPHGSIGISVFAIDLFFASHTLPSAGHLLTVGEFMTLPAHWRVLADLYLLAMFGDFYSVPLYALIQSRSRPSHRARIIAANNILNSLFMIVSALMAVALTSAAVGIPGLFLVTALLNVVVAVYIYSLVPEFLLRFVAWLYRIRLVHAERIPEEGAAVLVCNHVSYVDAIVIMAESPRPIRFVMDHRIFRTPFAGWMFRHAKAIPIAPAHEDADLLNRAYDACAKALDDGDLVCIFPEGKLTKTGEMNPFRHGVTEILRRSPAPVVPMALRGLWGSFWSRSIDARFPRPIQKGVMSRLTLAVGEPIAPAEASPEALQQVVSQLRGARKYRATVEMQTADVCRTLPFDTPRTKFLPFYADSDRSAATARQPTRAEATISTDRDQDDTQPEKNVLWFVTAFAVSGAATAAPLPDFDGDRFAACDAHSVGALLLARDAASLGKPVEAVLNDAYVSPDVLDVKLATLAAGALNNGWSKASDAPGLERFLAGVCYESGLRPKRITFRTQ